MSLAIRKSRFRHVYGAPAKESGCFRNLKISKNTHDSNLSDVNQKFLAVATESIGGGSFIVLNLSQPGRVPTDHPCVTGHRAAVTDVKWNPFNPNQIASSSDDGLVRIWNIPEEGLTSNIYKPAAELRNHASRVSYVQWHPLAENIIASVGCDKKIIVWNTNVMQPATAFGVFPDITYSISWSYSGQLLASTSKDRKIRIFDVRAEKVSTECPGHTGMRSSKVCFMRDDQRLLSCGFSKHGSRQIALWDIRDMSESVAIEMVDHGSGVMLLHYDPDLEIVYVIGKGDGNFRYFEILNCEPYFYHLSEYSSSQPQRAFCAIPKLGLDFTKNEIARIYKLYATGTTCEPISMIVPRKSESFQTDIYPDTLDCVPTMTAEEWLNGENRAPKLVSVKELQKNFTASQHVRLARIKDSAAQNQINDKATAAAEQPIMIMRTESNVLEKDPNYLANGSSHDSGIELSPIQPYTTYRAPKPNTVLDNVKKLEDTIRRFNSGTYVAKQKSPRTTPEVGVAGRLPGICGGKVREISQAFETGPVESGFRRSRVFTTGRVANEFDHVMDKGNVVDKEDQDLKDAVNYRPGYIHPKIIPVVCTRQSRSSTESDMSRKVDLSTIHFQRTTESGGSNISNQEQSYIQKVELAMKKINVGGGKGDHHHSSQPKSDKTSEQWRNVRELQKKLMSHEERIRQLESKVNAFVSRT